MQNEEKLKFFKPGLEVLYYGITAPIPERLTIRSEPWRLSCGSWVVSVVGRTGGLGLEHLECAHSMGSIENNVAKCSDCGIEVKIVYTPLLEPKDYPYTELFDHMANEHGLTLTNTELGEIIHIARGK